MDTSDNSRSSDASGMLFSHADLFGLESTFDYGRWWRCCDLCGHSDCGDEDHQGHRYFETPGFDKLVEAISQGDRALADQILRRWRVRR